MRGRKPVWTPADNQFLRDNAGRLSDADIAAALLRLTGRKLTANAVMMQRAKLGVAQAEKPGRHWLKPKPRRPPEEEWDWLL